MFINKEKQEFELVSGKATDVVSNLEAGLYKLSIKTGWFNSKHILLKKTERYKDAKIITSGVFKEATKHIDDFVSDKMYEIRNEMGLLHKLGLIFCGNPGTGKTFLAGQLVEKLAKEKNALGIISTGEPDIELVEFVDSLREEAPDRLIILLIDEYEKKRHSEIDMMSFLDGGGSRNNVIVIATVNSTTKLPETLIDRVGRIEKIYNFGEMNKEVIQQTIESIVPKKYKSFIDIKNIVKDVINKKIKMKIDNISIHIRNMIYSKIAVT